MSNIATLYVVGVQTLSIQSETRNAARKTVTQKGHAAVGAKLSGRHRALPSFDFQLWGNGTSIGDTFCGTLHINILNAGEAFWYAR